MKVDREGLLATLKIASVGCALPPRTVVLEQGDAFVFSKGSLVAFNDEVFTRTPSPLDFDCVVAATDLLGVLGTLPDREVDVELRGKQLVVRGKRRSAGITVQGKVTLPYTEVPKPGKWSKVREGATSLIKQAARTCGKDHNNPMTTVVHVTPELVEATDNARMFRGKGATGFPAEVLIPAYSLQALEAVPLYRVSIGDGWTHFKTSKKKGQGTMISVRGVTDDYMDDVDAAFAVEGAATVKLPGNLPDMLERSEIMAEGVDAVVRVAIEDGSLTLTSEKDTGWYREKKQVSYSGPPLRFQVAPKFFAEVLQRATTVQITPNKMKLQTDTVEFVVVLEAVDEKGQRITKKGVGKLKKVKGKKKLDKVSKKGED